MTAREFKRIVRWATPSGHLTKWHIISHDTNITAYNLDARPHHITECGIEYPEHEDTDEFQACCVSVHYLAIKATEEEDLICKECLAAAQEEQPHETE